MKEVGGAGDTGQLIQLATLQVLKDLTGQKKKRRDGSENDSETDEGLSSEKGNGILRFQKM